MSSFWDKERVIGMVPSGEKAAIRMAAVEKDGQAYLDVRKFVTGKAGKPGTFEQHTKSGLALPSDPDVLMAVAGSLIAQAEALKAAREAEAKAKAIKRPRKAKKGA